MADRRKSSVVEVAEDNSTLHVDDDVMRKASVAVDNFAGLSAEAKDGTEHEHSMGLMQAIKLYPKAVGWSILLSTAIVMEGYDVILLSSFYALPQFNKKYGVSVKLYMSTRTWTDSTYSRLMQMGNTPSQHRGRVD